MTAKNTRTIGRARTRPVSFLAEGENQSARRPQLIGKARVLPASDESAMEPGETDLLLHQSHGLVAQLREVVGRPRLDL